MNEGAWVAIAVAVITGGGSLYTAISTKRKVDADSESISVSTMRSVLEEVNKQLKDSRAELKECHAQRTDVIARLSRLEEQQKKWAAYVKLNHNIDLWEINGG